MHKLKKVVWGAATVLPLIYIFGILFGFRNVKYETIERVHYAIMVVYAVLLIAYVRDTRVNDRLPDAKRSLWTAMVIFGSSLAQIVYFWFYVWPEEKQV